MKGDDEKTRRIMKDIPNGLEEDVRTGAEFDDLRRGAWPNPEGLGQGI